MSKKFLVALAAAFWFGTGLSMALPQEPTLDVIADAWKRTQEKVRSGTFHWETRKWMEKGSKTPPDSAVVQPARDTTHTYHRTLTFTIGKVRYENSGPHWDSGQKKWVDDRQIYTWDGKKAVRYDGKDEAPSAVIYGRNVIAAQSEIRPIQKAFRMFSPSWFMFDAQKYAIAPSKETVDGLRCWNIETSPKLMRDKVANGQKPLKAVYTVCPDRNHAVVRYAAMNEATGEPTLKMEIAHVLDEETSVWVPSEWTITVYGAQGPFRIETSTVQDYSLNEAVSDEDFALSLPVGTRVGDTRSARNGEPKHYIVDSDREKRKVTKEEMLRGATRQELLETESGMAGLRQSQAGGVLSSPATYAWIFGILLLTVAGALVFRNQVRA